MHQSYVIVVSDIPESLKSGQLMKDSAKDAGLSDVQIFLGSTPRNCDPIRVFEQEGLDPEHFLANKFSRIPAAMSCFLSHYYLWKRCAAGKNPFLIFEHDARFIGKFNEKILEETLYCCSFGKPSYGNYRTSERQGIQKLFSKSYFPGAHSYVLFPEGAEMLIEEAKKNKPEPTDVFLNVKRFSWLQEWNPWITEVVETFSTVQQNKGILAKHAYKKNKQQYQLL